MACCNNIEVVKVDIVPYSMAVVGQVMMKVYLATMLTGIESTFRLDEKYINIKLHMHERDRILNNLEVEFGRSNTNPSIRSTSWW